jgi:hypothetical protein
MKESEETPELEAKSHSKSFLKKATKLAGNKLLGKGRIGRKTRAKRASRKRV